MNVYEQLGRLTEKHEALLVEYKRLLLLLSMAKSGEVDLKNLEVNLSADAWKLNPPTVDLTPVSPPLPEPSAN